MLLACNQLVSYNFFFRFTLDELATVYVDINLFSLSLFRIFEYESEFFIIWLEFSQNFQWKVVRILSEFWVYESESLCMRPDYVLAILRKGIL